MAEYKLVLGHPKSIRSGESTDSTELNDGKKHMMLMSNGTIWNSISDGYTKRCDHLTIAEKQHIQEVYMSQYNTIVQFQNDFGSHAWRMAKIGFYKNFRIWHDGSLRLFSTTKLCFVR